MARLGRVKFLAVAVVFHIVYIFSIFDIYFVSPIVSGMKAFSVENVDAPAKRLVLFVGDGLRADKAFQSFPDPSPSAIGSTNSSTPRPLAPFLRSRVLEHGTFGVSHTRVPTESRPGHVALIAGLYEDVSAVTTGWTLNPVNFDSVFNRSRHTWCWGSPDILPMFEQGALPGRVDAYTYGADHEDYSKDATELDTWVFNQVKGLFKEAQKNQTLNRALRQDKNVFFLHLLGLDTTGHAYRPYSREYLHNIQIVDAGVQEITELLARFYDDEKTAFVFTADHGMSDWGSHGDGHPDNTRTPLVAWGSGVSKPVIASNGKATGHEDQFSWDWGLDEVQRNDVSQADIAALMAYLVGLAFPVNSVGELPLAYLAAEPEVKAKAMLANAREILEMYRIKEEKKQSTHLGFKPFGPLGGDGPPAKAVVEHIMSLIEQERYNDAITASIKLIKLGLGGLRYLQTYDWFFLRTLVTLGYLGWMVFAITTVLDLHVLHGATGNLRTTASIAIFSAVFVALCSIIFIQQSSWTYYAYAVFPFMFWEQVYSGRETLVLGLKVFLKDVSNFGEVLGVMFKALAFVGVLEALVQSYYHREMYTICYFAAIVWPLFYGKQFVQQNMLLCGCWTLCCITMGVFTLLSVVKAESINLILMGGALMFTVGASYLLFEKSIISQANQSMKGLAAVKADGISRVIIGAQVGLIALAMLVTRSSVTSLQARQGLPLGTQIMGWVVLISSLTTPFLHGLKPRNDYVHRLLVIFLTFSPVFIILTISYEGLFYFTFCTTLFTWVRMEHHIHAYTNRQRPPNPEPAQLMEDLTPTQARAHGHSGILKGAPSGKPFDSKRENNYRSLTLADARVSLFFLYLLESAFFSTGNIASVSSFSLDAVYRLIPVFDPFSQGALLLLKLMIPFVVISATLGILNRRLGVAPSALFMVVMAVSDYLTVRFFWEVRDEGSWLDIGTSISQFVISSLLGVFVAGLEGFSEVLVGGVEFVDAEHGAQSVDDPKARVHGVMEWSQTKVNGNDVPSLRKVIE